MSHARLSDGIHALVQTHACLRSWGRHWVQQHELKWTLTTLHDGIYEQSSIAQHNRSKFPIVTNLIYKPEYSGFEIPVPISTLAQHADSTWW